MVKRAVCGIFAFWGGDPVISPRCDRFCASFGPRVAGAGAAVWRDEFPGFAPLLVGPRQAYLWAEKRSTLMTDAAILFDLDGTLIDSAPDLHAASARLLEREGRAALSPR